MTTHILLIEDDVELSTEVQDFLVRRGYDCRACGTIAEAESALSEGGYES